MKNYKTISLLALLTLGFASCTNFFEREPFSQVGADTFFRSEKDVVLYVNGLLQKNMPGYTTLTYGDQYSDLMAVNSTSDFLKTAWSAEKQTGWETSDWANIYNVNYFLSRLYEAASAVGDDARMNITRVWVVSGVPGSITARCRPSVRCPGTTNPSIPRTRRPSTRGVTAGSSSWIRFWRT